MTKTQLAAAIAAALQNPQFPRPAKKTKGRGRVKLTDEQKAVNAKANAVMAEKVFTEKGFKNCKANETILTYNRWLEKGRKVKPGESGTRIKDNGYALFHIDQTEEVVKSN